MIVVERGVIMENNMCMVCGNKNAKVEQIHDPVSKFISCPVCGMYKISEENSNFKMIDKNKLASFLFYKGFKEHTLPGNNERRYYTTIENETNSGGMPIYIDSLMVDSWYPCTLSEKTDKILLKLNDLSEYMGDKIGLDREALYSCFFVDRFNPVNGERRSEDELETQAMYMFDYLSENGYVQGKILDNNLNNLIITPKGYCRIEEWQRKISKGNDVLVAMKFGDDTKKLREAIRQGISEAKYNAIFIDEVEHNEFITPELLKHIRDSKFVVVDLTHQNNGAYFEEGYAMGLGKTVIQLCKKSTKLHFDIAQKNTIIWEREEDIPLRLKNRIDATIE